MPTQYTTNVNAPYAQQGVDLIWGTTLNFMIVTYDLKFGSTYLQSLSNISPIVFPLSSTAGTYVPTQFSTIKFTGVLTQNIIVQFPVGVGGNWYIENFATGAFNITLQVGSGPSGTTLIPLQGYRTSIRSDGLNIGAAETAPFWVLAPTIANNTVIANTSGGVAQPSPVNPSTLIFTSGLNMDGGTITNVATPVNPLDGVNKDYVDNEIDTVIDTRITQVAFPMLASLSITNNTGNPDEQIDLSASLVQMLDATNFSISRSAVAVTINSAVAGVNGLDTGAITANTWYNIWLIDNGTAPAGLLSLSATAPTLPAGYTYKIRCGAMRTDGSSDLYLTKQSGPRVQYVVKSGAPYRLMASTTSNISLSSFAPPTATGFTAALFASSNSSVGLFADSANAVEQIAIISGTDADDQKILVNFVITAPSIRLSIINGSNPCSVDAIGWVDAVNAF